MATFFGFFLMATALLPDEIHSIPLIGQMDPIRGQLLWQFPSFLLGSLFFLLGRLLKRKAAFAKPFALLLCLVSLLYINLGSISLFSSLYLLLFMLLLFIRRKELSRASFFYPSEDRLKDFSYIVGSLLITLLLLYLSSGNTGKESLGFLIFHKGVLHRINAFSKPHYFTVFLNYFLHLFAYFLIPALSYIAVGALARDKHFSFGEKFNQERFQNFLHSFSNTNLDASLAFLGDKLLYYYQEESMDKVVFQFALEDGKAVVMGEPIGEEKYFPAAISSFTAEAEEKNLTPLFYEVGQDLTLLLHNHGYEFMKFGETAKVPLSDFDLVGKSGKKFRAAVNKLENKGYSFKVMYPPFSDSFLQDLENISDAWLSGRQEKGFSLGFFDKNYLSLAPIACVLDSEGKVQAFSNFLICNGEKEASIDLMRYNPGTESNGIMDYLFVQNFLYFKEKGVEYFDLGMAPLSNVGQEEHSFFQEKLAFLVYAFTNRFYSFSGLRKYKDKFSPLWEARYLSYPKDSSLLFDLLAIFKIDNRKVKEL